MCTLISLQQLDPCEGVWIFIAPLTKDLMQRRPKSQKTYLYLSFPHWQRNELSEAGGSVWSFDISQIT